MADSQAQSIVDQALALAKSHPNVPAIEILDLAIQGRLDSDPDFEAPAGLPFSDWTDPESPFGALLAKAFAPEAAGEGISAETWEQVVMPGFAVRYRLWSQ